MSTVGSKHETTATPAPLVRQRCYIFSTQTFPSKTRSCLCVRSVCLCVRSVCLCVRTVCLCVRRLLDAQPDKLVLFFGKIKADKNAQSGGRSQRSSVTTGALCPA